MLTWYFRACTLSSSVFVVFDQSSQAKIGNLTDQIVSHQDVRSPQVSVDVVHPLDEGHAICNLDKTTGNQASRNSQQPIEKPTCLSTSCHGNNILGAQE